VVQQDERLQRRIRACTLDDAELAVRRVERAERRRRGRALPERVEAAAVERGAFVWDELRRIAARIGDGLPQARRLIGLDALAAELFDQEARREERSVSDRLGVQAKAGSAREP